MFNEFIYVQMYKIRVQMKQLLSIMLSSKDHGPLQIHPKSVLKILMRSSTYKYTILQFRPVRATQAMPKIKTQHSEGGTRQQATKTGPSDFEAENS